jgi:hypothetical protein
MVRHCEDDSVIAGDGLDPAVLLPAEFSLVLGVCNPKIIADRFLDLECQMISLNIV